MILCLETSTAICSVALCDNGKPVAVRESKGDKSHASQLTPFIIDILSEAGISAADVDAVAVSKGPGSYTGLRIGVSTAKGIAYGASVPLIGIETTYSMFCGIGDETREKYGVSDSSLYVPMLDARRMEIYYAVYSGRGEAVREIRAEVIDAMSFMDIPEEVRILFFGDGASKCRSVLKRRNIAFADEFNISASYMCRPAFRALQDKRFEDIAYFEPFYLKDFIASQPKKNILGR
jgi:tRNA threonylcarbamoyladenosine biosynthesis protein TsaB